MWVWLRVMAEEWTWTMDQSQSMAPKRSKSGLSVDDALGHIKLEPCLRTKRLLFQHSCRRIRTGSQAW